ncbi:MAG TPA: hypothetical protein VK589_15880 [Chryseolinea sp.]|nr:hypothetical protein [Chryseolinea sp.]
MKILSVLLFVLATVTGMAQTLLVEERTVKNEESIDLNSWTARLDQDMESCMDSYSAFIKETFKTKVEKRGKNILLAAKTQFPELSNLRLDQRAIFITESSGTSVSFTFSPGYDIHFGKDSYKAEFAKAETFVKGFVRFHYDTYYEAQIKTIQDKIKSLQSDIDSNSKKTDKNNKAITDNKSDGETDKSKSKNEKMTRENEQYTADSASKRTQITDLESQLSKFNQALQKTIDFK